MRDGPTWGPGSRKSGSRKADLPTSRSANKMNKIPDKFRCAIIAGLTEDERQAELSRLEALLKAELSSATDLPDWQSRLYSLIDELIGLGFYLGRWDYDCEVETWGGPSYMDESMEDDLLLRSEFPKGVRLAWKDYAKLTDG